MSNSQIQPDGLNLSLLWQQYKTETGRDYLPEIPDALYDVCRGTVTSDKVMEVREALGDVDERDLPAGMLEEVIEFLTEVRQLHGVIGRMGRQKCMLLAKQIDAALRQHKEATGS